MSSRVYVALRVKASQEATFNAFVGDIGLWWKPSPLFQTTPRAPGRLSFETGEGGRLVETLANGKVFEIGRILVWDPCQGLTFTWRQAGFPPDLKTEVEVRFEAFGAETRVSVEHRGFDQIPVENAARHSFHDTVLNRRLAEFWQAQLASLRQGTG